MPRVYRRTSLWIRFWTKVRVDPETGCWIWVGALNKGRRGYRSGHIRDGAGRWVKAHRQALIWAKGPPPDEDHGEAGHKCPSGGNMRCVNPDHLKWVTREENERDKRNGCAA